MASPWLVLRLYRARSLRPTKAPELYAALTELSRRKAYSLLDHAVFQNLFGMIMTLLIAMEFKHSIIRVVLRQDSIVQVKTVVLIALIALARKFVILDAVSTEASKIAALAMALLALGGVYWLLRERDDRLLGRPANLGLPRANRRDPRPADLICDRREEPP